MNPYLSGHTHDPPRVNRQLPRAQRLSGPCGKEPATAVVSPADRFGLNTDDLRHNSGQGETKQGDARHPVTGRRWKVRGRRRSAWKWGEGTRPKPAIPPPRWRSSTAGMRWRTSRYCAIERRLPALTAPQPWAAWVCTGWLFLAPLYSERVPHCHGPASVGRGGRGGLPGGGDSRGTLRLGPGCRAR